MKKKTSLSLALALALTGCAHQQTPAPATFAAAGTAASAAPVVTPDAAFRTGKPAPAANPITFSPPVPVERTLPDGARLLVVENHAVPLVAVDVMVETGSDGDPIAKAGLSALVGNMLTEGTKTRTAAQFAEQMDDLAVNFTMFSGKESTQIVGTSLTETLPAALDLLADALINPAFRKEDIERRRGLSLMTILHKGPSMIARDEVSRVLYGDKHPWGQPEWGTAETLKAITQADLVRFHDLYYRPTNVIISISGDVSADDVQKLLEAKLKSWKKRPRVAVKLPKVKPPAQRTVVLVDKPGATQSQVWAFGPAVAANDPDAIPLRVASFILGGPFARLDLNLRENKGYSYGVRSDLTLMRTQGYWAIMGGIKANVTTLALTEYEKELTGFSTGKLGVDELEHAREALVRSLPSWLERNSQVAMSMAHLALDGQPLDYYRTLPAQVDKVDPATVARVAAKYDQPDAWSIVIVGPRAASEQKLKAMNLGPVIVRDASDTATKGGKPAAPSTGHSATP